LSARHDVTEDAAVNSVDSDLLYSSPPYNNDSDTPLLPPWLFGDVDLQQAAVAPHGQQIYGVESPGGAAVADEVVPKKEEEEEDAMTARCCCAPRRRHATWRRARHVLRHHRPQPHNGRHPRRRFGWGNRK
jgi:hypothetical protein